MFKDNILTLTFCGEIISLGWSNISRGIMAGLHIIFPAFYDSTEPSCCLELIHNQHITTINQIYAGKAVPAHIEKKGTWLMHLALAILQIKIITLENRSGFQNYGSLGLIFKVVTIHYSC